MKTVLFTDTHFGIKQNSITWLNAQLDFIDNQLLPFLKNLKSHKETIRLIHLGDIFDCRSTISTYISTMVVKSFTNLRQTVDEFILIGGNHDYYSPNTNRIDTLNLILHDMDLKIVTTEPLIEGTDLFADWYSYQDETKINNLIKKYKIKRLFTHADIVMEPPKYSNIEIFTGHIHTPLIKGRLKNLGSCFPLDFGDSNSKRGFYVLDEETNQLEFHENLKSIRFWRFYNETLFDMPENFNKNDYIEIYVLQKNLSDEKYIKAINYLTNKYKNIWIIPQTNIITESNDVEFNGYDIDAILRDLIPDKLQTKFKLILNNL